MTTVLVTLHTLAMTRFVLATSASSARQLLAIAIALAAIGWGGYLGSHPLNRVRGCWDSGFCRTGTPALSSRFVWQIPVAVLLGLAGVGSALVVTGRCRPERRLPSAVMGLARPDR